MRTTPFLSLRPPLPGVMYRESRPEDALGDDTEVIGRDLRLALNSSAEVATLLKLSRNRTGVAAGVSEASHARVLATSGGVALCALVGMINHRLVTADGQVVQPPPDGDPVVPTSETEVFKAASATPGMVQQDTERSITNVVGYQVGQESVLFDGTGNLLVHSTQKSHLALADGSLRFGSYTQAWDNTLKWERVQFTISNKDPSEVLDLYYPLHFPPNFSSWNNGNGPSLWFRYSAPEDCSVTASIGGLGNIAKGSTGGTRSLATLSYADLDFHEPAAGGISWLRLRLATSGGGDVSIDVETTLGFRYQQLRSL